MEQQDIIINKVANSGLVTIDLEHYYPSQPFLVFDLKGYLFMELILKEKDFREALKNTDWNVYKNANVCVLCSADAIIPVWAYMLIAAYLKPIAHQIYNSNIEDAISNNIIDALNKIDTTAYEGQRVVVKGCGEKQIAPSVYLAITALLQPFAKSIMYGEPCSTVPIYKAK